MLLASTSSVLARTCWDSHSFIERYKNAEVIFYGVVDKISGEHSNYLIEQCSTYWCLWNYPNGIYSFHFDVTKKVKGEIPDKVIVKREILWNEILDWNYCLFML